MNPSLDEAQGGRSAVCLKEWESRFGAHRGYQTAFYSLVGIAISLFVPGLALFLNADFGQTKVLFKEGSLTLTTTFARIVLNGALLLASFMVICAAYGIWLSMQTNGTRLHELETDLQLGKTNLTVTRRMALAVLVAVIVFAVIAMLAWFGDAPARSDSITSAAASSQPDTVIRE